MIRRKEVMGMLKVKEVEKKVLHTGCHVPN